MSNLVVESIKVGRETHKVKKGDYILYNGACYQFMAGDGRILKWEGFTGYSNLKMPMTLIKKIPFIRMTKVDFNKNGMDLVKWYF